MTLDRQVDKTLAALSILLIGGLLGLVLVGLVENISPEDRSSDME